MVNVKIQVRAVRQEAAAHHFPIRQKMVSKSLLLRSRTFVN